jgi:hypothetical protein
MKGYTIQGKTFVDMRGSLEDLFRSIQDQIQQGASSDEKNALLDSLEGGKKLVDRLMERFIHEGEFCKFIKDRLEARECTHLYLEAVKKNHDVISERKRDHLLEIEEHVIELVHALHRSESCEIPQVFQQQADSHSVPLKFPSLVKKKKALRQRKPTMAQFIEDKRKEAENDETQAWSKEEIKQMFGVPSMQYTVSRLMRKGVIVGVAEDVAKLTNNLLFTFYSNNHGGWNVEVVHCTLKGPNPDDRKKIREFTLAFEDLHSMTVGKKTCLLPYPQGEDYLFIMNCHRLRYLLGWISAEAGMVDVPSRVTIRTVNKV